MGLRRPEHRFLHGGMKMKKFETVVEAFCLIIWLWKVCFGEGDYGS
jgi:hypothetical protein